MTYTKATKPSLCYFLVDHKGRKRDDEGAAYYKFENIC